MSNITVILTQEEYNAMTVLTVMPEEWIQTAAINKARKMRDVLVEQYSDKQANKMTVEEKNVILGTIDLEKEKDKRRGKKI